MGNGGTRVSETQVSELEKIDRCAKRPIDVWTNYLYYPLSIRLVWALRRTSVTPNGLTLFSLFLCLVGCVFFGVGHRPEEVIGLVLVQVSYVFDCADGQLARYKQLFSPIGGWLDQVADRIKEFAIYYSLAFGWTRGHHNDVAVWRWALVALFSLYLLEYFGQIHFKPKHSVLAPPAGVVDREGTSLEETGTPSGSASDSMAETSRFLRAQQLRGLVPFRGFIIGEQYFVMLVFLAVGAIVPMFYFVACLGLLMCAYRPAVQLYKWNRGL